jgi:hypothetical protein
MCHKAMKFLLIFRVILSFLIQKTWGVGSRKAEGTRERSYTMPHALCPMPYALCPIPNSSLSPPHPHNLKNP